ncbi:MAG: ABC transporter permease [Dehalococcoidia bacterium]|nr:ABC transporter permease [Chloroflexota bacterium]MXY72135.1 ABC transporter permease [Dehalococcoidia bacterium]
MSSLATQATDDRLGGFMPPDDPSLPIRALRGLGRFFARKTVGAVALVIASIILVLGIIGPWIAPYGPDDVFEVENPNYDVGADPTDPANEDKLNPIIGQWRLNPNPTWDHPLGVDHGNRDLLTRVLHGARRSMLLGFGAAAIATIFGAILGVGSGYFGGVVDLVSQRLVDAFIAFPPLLFLLLLLQTGEATLPRTIIALSFLNIFGVSRVVRSATLAVRNDVFVEAARVMGAQPPRIIFRHVFPNVFAPIIIIFSTTIGGAILAESTLAFLGLAPPGPSWGAMVNNGRQFFGTEPILVAVGGGALTLTVLAFNIFGDALRDVLDPRLRGA